MSFDLALIISFFILIITVMVLGAIFGSRKQAEKEEELKRAASARGWQFESTLEKGYRVHRWTGATDGVSWVAESLRLVAGGNNRQRRRHIARWHGAWSPGINKPIAVMGVPKGKEIMGATIAGGDGFFARLAQKAVGFAFDKAIDVYFGDAIGKDVDAGTMQRVDGENIPGFIVMAEDKVEGARILAQGFEKAIVDASNDKASVLADEDRPWILLRTSGISLARMERYRDIAELEGFVRAGVALTRAFTFGRRSPS
jgi:hypothetical protein